MRTSKERGKEQHWTKSEEELIKSFYINFSIWDFFSLLFLRLLMVKQRTVNGWWKHLIWFFIILSAREQFVLLLQCCWSRLSSAFTEQWNLDWSRFRKHWIIKSRLRGWSGVIELQGSLIFKSLRGRFLSILSRSFIDLWPFGRCRKNYNWGLFGV